MKKDKFKIGLIFILIFLSIFSIYIIHPQVEGDSVSYVQSIELLRGQVSLSQLQSGGFIPNRIVTSFLHLASIMLIDKIVSSVTVSWLIVNTLLYIAMGIFFYLLLAKILENKRAAFLGTLFLATNYAGLIFSFHYLVDVGGWVFYIVSLHYSFRYLETKEQKFAWISGILVGLGGLFKEYAFLAYIVLFGLIIFLNWKKWGEIIKKSVATGLLAFIPMFIVNICTFFAYHYTYLDWFFHQPHYFYKSLIVEYIKSFGSLYTFGWFLFLPGLYIFLKRYREILKDEKLLFTSLVIVSSLFVFVWPVVTRVLFITVPALVMISSFFLKKFDKWWYAVLPLLALYVLSTYLMDTFILNFVNLPF